MKRRILCFAEAFGFGPISKLLNFLDKLKINSKNCDLIFFGDGCALDLARRYDFSSIYTVSPEKILVDNRLIRSIGKIDWIISSMEFRGVRELKEYFNCKLIIIDSLLWFWPEIPINQNYVDYYICQNFIGVKNQVKALTKSENKGPFYVVSPILSQEQTTQKTQSEKGKIILISFGGLENPFLDDIVIYNYCKIIVELILEATIELSDFTKIFLGNSKFISKLEKNYSNNSCSFQTVKPNEMQGLMRRAKYLFAAPGLETFYEAINVEIPVFFLPPTNNSQLIQLQLFIRELNYSHDTYRHIWDFDAYDVAKNPQTSIKRIINKSIEYCSVNNSEISQNFKLFLQNGSEFQINKSMFYNDNDEFIFEKLKVLLIECH